MEELREVIEQLESERQMLTHKVDRIEKELRRYRQLSTDTEQQVQQLQHKLSKVTRTAGFWEAIIIVFLQAAGLYSS